MATKTDTKWSRNDKGRLERSTELSLCHVVSFVCEFLTPRELYSTFFASKGTMKSITHIDITKNALCNGNLAMKNTIENVYDLTLYGKIYLPTCARLIRLVNARRCELCNSNRINQVRSGFGMAICFPCLLGNPNDTSEIYTSELLIEPARYRLTHIGLNELVRHPRVSTEFQGFYVHLRNGRKYHSNSRSYHSKNGERHFIWDHHLLDNQGRRKRIGPIVTKEDIDVFTTMRRMDEVESYITDILKAPELKVFEDFNDAVRQYRPVAYARAITRQKVYAMKEKKASEARRLKLLRVQGWVHTISESTMPDWRHLLHYRVNTAYLTYGSRQRMRERPIFRYHIEPYSHLHVIHFLNPQVHTLLSKYVTAPSRMVGHVLKSACTSLIRLRRQNQQAQYQQLRPREHLELEMEEEQEESEEEESEEDEYII